MPELDRRVCIAPMMGWTDRHARYFHRQISRNVLVYSEMLAPEAVLYGRRERYLRYHPEEHPVAFQLGGHRPQVLAAAARELEKVGYDEINFNVGCPSQKGKKHPFGAHLMKQPQVVRECLEAMAEAVDIPVTIKTRIGVDDHEGYQPLADFVGQTRESGCRVYIIHARKAWLDGLSPRANRDVPPLHYEYVYRLKREFPELTVILNGGLTEWSEIRQHLAHVDGVMVGRRAYKEPFWLAEVDREIFGGEAESPSPPEILRRCIPYVEEELASGTSLRSIVRHMVGLYRNAPAASAFRRHIALEGNPRGAGLDVFLGAIRIAERLSRPGRFSDASVPAPAPKILRS